MKIHRCEACGKELADGTMNICYACKGKLGHWWYTLEEQKDDGATVTGENESVKARLQNM